MKLLKRLVFVLVGGLLALMVAVLVGLFLLRPTLTTRLVGLAFGGASGPQQTIAGGQVPELQVAAEEKTLGEAELQAAVAWGASMDSHALLVWQGGALQLEHYYPGHGPEGITATQSMHKSVLAMLVGIAIDQGLIKSVDDKAANYIKEWAGDERRNITIRQMLQQASGIDFPGFTGLLEMTLGGDVAPFTFSRGTMEKGGQHFEYNNINPEVLGILLQRVSGLPYSEYLQKPVAVRECRPGSGSA